VTVHAQAQPRLALLLVLVGCMSLFGWPFLSLLPKLAQSALGEAERGYSLMLTGTGCGALLAALVLASRRGANPRPRYLWLGAALTAIALAGLSLASTLPAAIACCAAVGAGLILFFATSQSIVQLSASEHNRGRIMGIWSMICCAGQPLGNLIGGPTADLVGEPLVLRLESLGCAAAVALLLFSRAGKRREARQVKFSSRAPSGRLRPRINEAADRARGGALPRPLTLEEPPK
jgi:predicted MFS family arabinose efflux permease